MDEDQSGPGLRRWSAPRTSTCIVDFTGILCCILQEEEEEEEMEDAELLEKGVQLSDEQTGLGINGRVKESGSVARSKEDDLGTLSDYELGN